MSFIKDDDFQIRFETLRTDGMIQVLAYDRATRQEVRLGYVRGADCQRSDGTWMASLPDQTVAEKVRTMVHQALNNIQDLT